MTAHPHYSSFARDFAPDPADYGRFLEAKRPPAIQLGVPLTEVAPLPAQLANGQSIRDHQLAIVRWAIAGGRRAIFAKFGLGKSIMQLLILSSLVGATGKALLVAPLGVRTDLMRDAAKLGLTLRFVNADDQVAGPGLYLANYEPVRDGKLDPAQFDAASLDEASVLRGFGGTKTFREFMRLFDTVRYRFVATATPSPNEYIELLAYAAFLGVMDVGEAKTRFFKRDSTNADKLTLHPHKEEEFWLWCSTWAVFLQTPSDLGFSDEGYALPPLKVNWHAVQTDLGDAGVNGLGQGLLIRDAALGVAQASAEKRRSLAARIEKARTIVEASPDDHFLLWHDLEDERRALEGAMPDMVSVYGSQPIGAREEAIVGFADGHIRLLGGKPIMLGSGPNFQRHCHRAVFVGVGFKFNDFIQALHRIWRFLQVHDVEIDIIFSETEREVVRTLQAKWKRHDAQMERMSAIIREFGLNTDLVQDRLVRTIGCTREEKAGEGWRAIRNDCVVETQAMPADSVDLIVTSIPFGNQYEYSPSYNDFGHTDDNAHFFDQLSFLTPQLLRILKPGRRLCVHVKDRVRPGGMEGVSFQSIDPFHAECIQHYRRLGFFYDGMITVVTDVVRENSQTYRLGWTEKCKDGACKGVGLPEYVLLFRKAPTDAANGYSDERVVHHKATYTRARWQLDAHAFWRSAGNRLLAPDELLGLPAKDVYRQFRAHSIANPYDFAGHVAVGQAHEDAKSLPPGFMLLPPQSWHDDVWTDVTRMRTLNGAQNAKGREMHLCPLQFDIVDRLIETYSQAGETVFDPFGGLMTVPLRALQLGRRGLGCELNGAYYADGMRYLEEAERERSVPSLFDLMAAEAVTEGEVP